MKKYPDDHQAYLIECLKLKLDFELLSEIEPEEIQALAIEVENSKESINDNF